jgi:hypothetical protein
MAFSPGDPVDLFNGQLPGPGPDPGTPLCCADYDFSEVNDYSRIELAQLRSTLGWRFQATKFMDVFASVAYYDVQDDSPYIENLTGDVTLLRGGFKWIF